MTALLPNGMQYFTDNDGEPLSLGTVEFYIPSTLTPKDTWQNVGQTILNTNPVVLDASGRAIIYGAGVYRQIVRAFNGDLIWDQLTTAPAIPGPATKAYYLSNYSTLALADAAAVTGVGILVIDMDATVGVNTILSAPSVIGFGGVLTINNGITLTISHPLTAEGRIFSCQGTGAVLFKEMQVVNVMWFGAVSDGATDSTTSIQKTYDSISTAGGTVVFPPSPSTSLPYIVTSTITHSGTWFKTYAWGAIISGTNVSGYVVNFGGNSTTVHCGIEGIQIIAAGTSTGCLTVHDIVNTDIRDFRLNPGTGCNGLTIGGGMFMSMIQNGRIQQQGTGIVPRACIEITNGSVSSQPNAMSIIDVWCVGNITTNIWTTVTNYSVGTIVVATSANEPTGGYVFQCTSAGISAVAEPTWPNTEGGTVVDGTVTWTAIVNCGIRAENGQLGTGVTTKQCYFQSIGYGTWIGSSNVNYEDDHSTYEGTGRAAYVNGRALLVNPIITGGVHGVKCVGSNAEISSITKSGSDPQFLYAEATGTGSYIHSRGLLGQCAVTDGTFSNWVDFAGPTKSRGTYDFTASSSTLTNSYWGQTITNKGAAGTVTLTLPVVSSAGLNGFIMGPFYNYAGQTFRIKAGVANKILGCSTTNTYVEIPNTSVGGAASIEVVDGANGLLAVKEFSGASLLTYA